MRVFREAALLGCIMAGVCSAQKTVFEVASVKLAGPAERLEVGHKGGPGTADPGRVHYCCDAMLTLVTRAYGVESDRISGPPWISDFTGPMRYVIDAVVPSGATKAEFRLMLQNLLAERFHLVVHHEMRSFPGYDLVVAKSGSKLKEVTLQQTTAAGDVPVMKSMEGPGMLRIQSTAKSIHDLTDVLGSMLTQAFGADPADLSVPKARINDKTGLTGKYNYTLEFACEGCRAPERIAANAPGGGSPGKDASVTELPGIFVAIERQLGLKLEASTSIPLDVIVVDHVDKLPTSN